MPKRSERLCLGGLADFREWGLGSQGHHSRNVSFNSFLLILGGFWWVGGWMGALLPTTEVVRGELLKKVSGWVLGFHTKKNCSSS